MSFHVKCAGRTREVFRVMGNGDIGRPAIGLSPTGAWKMLGAERHNNFGNVVEFVPMNRIGELVGRELLHKNGRPQWFLRDLDHGTMRVQMCGIASIRPY